MTDTWTGLACVRDLEARAARQPESSSPSRLLSDSRDCVTLAKQFQQPLGATHDGIRGPLVVGKCCAFAAGVD
jgi:hypothetical protein